MRTQQCRRQAVASNVEQLACSGLLLRRLSRKQEANDGKDGKFHSVRKTDPYLDVIVTLLLS